MKKLFTLLIFVSVSILSFAQITPADVGLPDNVFNDLKNVVFSERFEQCSKEAPGHNPIELTMFVSTKTVNGVTTRTEEVVVREYKYRKPGIRYNVGAYCLNMIIPLIHDNGYNQIIKTDTGYVFQKPDATSKIVIWQKNSKWYSKFENNDYGFHLMHPKTKTFKYYSSAELMQFRFIPRNSSKPIPITMAMIVDWSQNYRIGYLRDPNVYICNMLTKIVKLGDQTQVNGDYMAQIYINEKNVMNLNEGLLITSFGTKGLSFTPRWVFMNGCIKGDGGTINGGASPGSAIEYGNGGACGNAQSSQGVSDDFMTIRVVQGTSFSFDGQTVTYDASKPFWLWSKNETYQSQGKNEQSDGYYDVTKQKIRYSLFGS